MQKIIALFCVVLAGYLFYLDIFILSFIVFVFAIGLLLTTRQTEVLDFDSVYSKDGSKQSSDSNR